MGPLDGIRILDLTRLLPGAFATALLADLGADVIKIEQPGGGDPMRAYEPKIGSASGYTWVTDRNKRSLTLDLREQRDELLRLVVGADALIESFRPGVMERLGLGYEELAAVKPSLVYVSVSGYGADGPLARAAGHDINYIGRAGVLGVTERPAVPGVQIADLAGGSLLGVAGLLAALIRAKTTGEGDHVDVSMTDGAFALQAVNLGGYFANGQVPDMLTGGAPCYGVYECSDGRWLTVGALEPPFWREFCAGVEREDLVPRQFDPAARAVVAEVLGARTRDEWLAVFEGRDACVGPVNSLAEAIADPQLRSRGMVVDDFGAAPQLGTPLKFRAHPASLRTPAPELGALTLEQLAAGS
jgi:crotonobetainyl-CoA:carnitine CoA-transferase CaiB-like acyl-CoA transferase